MPSRSLPRSSGAARALRDAWLTALRLEGWVRSRRERHEARRTGGLHIVACSPTYLPVHRRGAEVSLHAVLRSLRARGHEIRVLVDPGGSAGVVDGIEVVIAGDAASRMRHGRWADLIVGQLAARWHALALAARTGHPSVYFMHVGNVPRRSLYGRPDLTVFNSLQMRERDAWISPAIVVHPPVFGDDYRTTPGEAITLVNLTEPKGAPVFFELARRLPEHQFLGVRGIGRQDIPSTLPANVTVIDHTTDMRSVYARTRVLLVPSSYESYGRVALEAAASGIPTLAQPTAGLREAMGDAATWIDRADVEEWVRQLEALTNLDAYARASELARARFDAMDPRPELDELERRLVGLARREAS